MGADPFSEKSGGVCGMSQRTWTSSLTPGDGLPHPKLFRRCAVIRPMLDNTGRCNAKRQVLEISEYLAGAALVAAGIELVDVRPPVGFRSRCVLVFNDGGGQASRVLADHQCGKLMVESLRYAQAVNDLKGRIFSARG